MKFELQDLNLNNISAWSSKAKRNIFAGVIIVTLLIGYYVDTQSQVAALDLAVAEEHALRNEFESKQQKSANLASYQKQLVEMEKIFSQLVIRLPTENEMSGLLEDISDIGVTSGLKFKLFDPQPEVKYDFYAELPIRISVIGQYEQLAKFASQIAQLDRIVTFHDLEITPAQGEIPGQQTQDNAKNILNTGALIMNVTVKVYRYAPT